MTFMKRAKATWSVDLMADCPYCKEYIDCFSSWCEQEGYHTVKIAESKELNHNHGNEDLIVECEKCKKEFVISHTEY